MRGLRVFFALLLVVFPVHLSVAQEFVSKFHVSRPSAKNHPQKIPLTVALSELARAFNMHIVFDDALVQNKYANADQLAGEDFYKQLASLLEGNQLTYKYIGGRTVVVLEKEPEPPQPKRIRISGVVVSKKDGSPLPGANVFIKGTRYGAATDVDGRFQFSLPAEKDFVLVVKFMGYKKLERRFSPEDDLKNLRFELEEDIFMTEEVVVTGVATRTAKEVAEVAVSRIRADQLTQLQAYQDLSQLITAKVPGVRIENVSGNPGSGFRFNMRSGGGLNGDEQPVIYVDGVRIDNSEYEGAWAGGQGISLLADLNPEDIEKIEILKGPAAAASYGTNGSNGVILITTKRGRLAAGRKKLVNVNYKIVLGYNTPSYRYKQGDYYYFTWRDMNAIHRNGPIQQQTVSATGGTELVRYYVSLDRRFEYGLLPNSRFDRKTLRANFDAYPSRNLTISVSTGFSLSENERPQNDNNLFAWLGNVIRYPTYSACDSLAIASIKNVINGNRFVGSVQVVWSPVPRLEARINLGVDNSDLRNWEFRPPGFRYGSLTEGRKNIRTRNNLQVTYTADLRYSFSPAEGLNITSTVGTQLFEQRTRSTFMEKRNFLSPLIWEIEAGAEYTGMAEGLYHARQAGLFMDHAFSYQSTYFFSFMLRRDYASVVGKKAPSILYPRASFAVRFDRFPFVPQMFNLLKLRAGYGETGVLPDFLDGVPLLWGTRPSAYGIGAEVATIGNEKIKPERVKEVEFGLESEILGRYSFEFTFYRQTAEESILEMELPPSTGKTADNMEVNVGRVKGWGIETLLQARLLDRRNLRLDLSMTHSYQTNEVVDMGGAQPIIGSRGVNVIKEGLPKHAFYHYKVYGARFDENGRYAGPKRSKTKVYLGVPIPPYTGSLSLDLALFRKLRIYGLFEWATGHSILNYTHRQAIRERNNKRWRELRDILGMNDYFEHIDPAPVGSPEYIAAAHEYAFYDRSMKGNFIEPADYLKLREISISYDMTQLGKQLLGPLFPGVAVGFSARNVWTTTKYSGPSVEVNYSGARSLNRGVDYFTVQMPRVFNFWIRFSF